jgi:hypothetical protein
MRTFANMKPRLVEGPWNKVIHLLSGIRDTHRSNDHHEHLKDFQACPAQAKSEHVFTSANRVI